MSVPDNLSPKQFSQRSGLALKTVYRRLHDGDLPFLQFGGRRHRILIPRTALDLVQPAKSSGPTPSPTAVPSVGEPAPKCGRKPRWLGDLPK
jgi:excisionase family DNA binding protein